MRVYYHSRISSNYYYHTLTLNKDYIYVKLHSYRVTVVTLLHCYKGVTGVTECNL